MITGEWINGRRKMCSMCFLRIYLIRQLIACVIPSHGSLLSHSVTGVCHGNYGMASPVVLVTIPSDEND
ncbi:hypothetical protein PVAP13_4NG331400 [Panicum virgatum]|uniref:Uncharacterized protein n=1 Tax=Panicum virgatum TaxID=38727 RepID=A0A8T0TBV7_PANVG|nr:hypothetical protein PVAP13_4NG331400 [Panicum virgatum]